MPSDSAAHRIHLSESLLPFSLAFSFRSLALRSRDLSGCPGLGRALLSRRFTLSAGLFGKLLAPEFFNFAGKRDLANVPFLQLLNFREGVGVRDTDPIRVLPEYPIERLLAHLIAGHATYRPDPAERRPT